MIVQYKEEKKITHFIQPLVCCFLLDFSEELEDEAEIFERECDVFIHDFVIKIFNGRWVLNSFVLNI